MNKILKSLFFATVFSTAAVAADNFGGLGISVYAGKSGVTVAGVMPNSPAEKIGLKAGDLIISANGTELYAVEPQMQVSYLRGSEGSSINLTVKRASEKINLSTKRVGLSVQNLEEKDISSWYGKSEGLSAEEINYLAAQKTAGGYEALGTMQNGLPITGDTENLNGNEIKQISVKKPEEEHSEINEKPTQNNFDENKDYSLFNVKGAHAKKQVNKEKKSVNPIFKVK